jgi:hypothetical protein
MVRTFDFNPHMFAYGGAHYYVIAGLAVAPVAAMGWIASAVGLIDGSDAALPDLILKWTLVAARMVSAVMTAATVAMTIEIGARLFAPAAGLAAGSLLLAAPGSVVIAHYATVDAAANFWYWLACLGTLNIWKTGARGSYLLSGIAAGLAIGTKIDRLLVLLPLVVGHLLRGREGRHRDLLGALAVAAIAFLASNFYIVTAPFEFLDGFTRDLMFNAFAIRAESPIRQFAMALKSSLGAPLVILVSAGSLLGIFLLLRRQRYTELLWAAATFLPIAAVYSVTKSLDRYVTILFPALALLAGHAAAKLLCAGPLRVRAFAALPLAAALAWSLLLCAAVDLVLLRDPRYAAIEWLDRHAPAGARIAVDRRGPWLSRERYHVSLLEPDHAIQEDDMASLKRLQQCESCNRFRERIFAIERKIGSILGRESTRRPYRGWYDIDAGRIESERTQPDALPDADYVVLLPHRKPVTAKRLGAAGSGYELAAAFPAPRPLGIRLPFTLIGRPVEIFARKDS